MDDKLQLTIILKKGEKVIGKVTGVLQLMGDKQEDKEIVAALFAAEQGANRIYPQVRTHFSLESFNATVQ